VHLSKQQQFASVPQMAVQNIAGAKDSCTSTKKESRV
jgi:hypothetical protein